MGMLTDWIEEGKEEREKQKKREEQELKELENFALVTGVDTFIDTFVPGYLDDSNDKDDDNSYNNDYDYDYENGSSNNQHTKHKSNTSSILKDQSLDEDDFDTREEYSTGKLEVYLPYKQPVNAEQLVFFNMERNRKDIKEEDQIKIIFSDNSTGILSREDLSKFDDPQYDRYCDDEGKVRMLVHKYTISMNDDTHRTKYHDYLMNQGYSLEEIEWIIRDTICMKKGLYKSPQSEVDRIQREENEARRKERKENTINSKSPSKGFNISANVFKVLLVIVIFFEICYHVFKIILIF